MLPENEWFCSKIVVTTPDDGTILFPCYRWLSRGEHMELRGGKAMKAFEDDHPLLIDHRAKEVKRLHELYQWNMYAEGTPYSGPFKDIMELPPEVRLSVSKEFELVYTAEVAIKELQLKGLKDSPESWENLDEAIKNIFWFYKTPVSNYVQEHWMDDDFFGYQFLNGVNPNMIQRCQQLPSNFPVTEAMVSPFLEEGSSLEMEMGKGNIFLSNYKILDGLPTRLENGVPRPLTAALCLFYKNPENKLVPIAIQLGQQPSEQNPIFLPSDLKHDWLLAKIFVKNADTIQHQVVSHLMRTHYLAEVYANATFRHFPVIHPFYKLLIPHFYNTLQINILAHTKLTGSTGVLTGPTSAIGDEGMNELTRRGLPEATYSSLCLPESISARGLDTVPNFYYRDDGLKLWNIINRFVRAIVKHYYPLDIEVARDTELQEWIKDIFTYGFLGNSSTGIPDHFDSAEEVVKFITMVIFTTSGQHAAVNNGMFEYSRCVPNNSLMLRKAPPTTKGQSSMETILETLPHIGASVRYVSGLWLLCKTYTDSIPLGVYPYERFDEPVIKGIIEDFQADLSTLSEAIKQRNLDLEQPYRYLIPADIQNSISI